MNRLWVRLSVVISALILVTALIPTVAFLSFVMTHSPPETAATTTAATSTADSTRPPPPDPWRRISQEVVQAFVLAGIFGIAGGIAAGRVLALPVSRLAGAAHAIGAGDLSARVPVERTSREIEELTQAFNRMAADLERAADLRTALMADVSHELRTPLTVLEGNLRAALDHVYALDDEQIANLYEQTRHLIRLVNDLRELALAEADQLPLDRHHIDLGLLAEETVAVFAPLADEKEVVLSAEVAAGVPPVLADRVRMRQVLHNLLGNALRHSRPGGQIQVSVVAEGGEVILAVTDDGDGIDAQHLAHVFDRFYRTDPSRSRETGGSGLGLAIARAVVEAHGGRIEAWSPGPGAGSRFAVRLPEVRSEG